MLDAHTLSDLVRLRAALEHAERLAADRSAPGVHVALVALDGVCEYGMWLALLHRGVPLADRASFHDALNKLIGELRGWPRSGRRGIVQLHGARNQAQHGGTLPDPDLIPAWTREVDAFVRTLVLAAFEVELEDVLLTSAVEDDALRERIAAAEHALNADAPAEAFAAAVEAFLAARRRWRDQQSDAYPYMASESTFDEERSRQAVERALTVALALPTEPTVAEDPDEGTLTPD